jgi:hypothetical protein
VSFVNPKFATVPAAVALRTSDSGHQRVHPEHRAAQRKGRDSFYSEYRIQVCPVARETRFPRAVSRDQERA